MDTKRPASSSSLSLFKVTTTREVILYARHDDSGRALVSISDAAPYKPCLGIFFRPAEPVVVSFFDGEIYVGGIVLTVEKMPDAKFEPMP